jgi:hypothetical protein
MGRRRERRPHRKRGCGQSPRGHYRDDHSTSGFTGKPALILDRPGGIPQGYGLTSRRSVTEPRWVSSPPSYCATAPLTTHPRTRVQIARTFEKCILRAIAATYEGRRRHVKGAAAAHAMLAGSYAAYKGLFVIAARPQPPVGRRHVLTSRDSTTTTTGCYMQQVVASKLAPT